jgi:hypothetical protein
MIGGVTLAPREERGDESDDRQRAENIQYAASGVVPPNLRDLVGKRHESQS